MGVWVNGRLVADGDAVGDDRVGGRAAGGDLVGGTRSPARPPADTARRRQFAERLRGLAADADLDLLDLDL